MAYIDIQLTSQETEETPHERPTRNGHNTQNNVERDYIPLPATASLAAGTRSMAGCSNHIAAEPVDILWDEDLEENRLVEACTSSSSTSSSPTRYYDALIVPCLYVCTETVLGEIKAFADAGGRVIAHNNSVLANQQVSGLRTLDGAYHDGYLGTPTYSLAPKYCNTCTKDVDFYHNFLSTLAADIVDNLPYGHVTFDTEGKAIVNVMHYDGTDYVALINDQRTNGGDEDTWYSEFFNRSSKIRENFDFDYDYDYGQDKKTWICNRYRDESGTPRPLRDVLTSETFWPGCSIELNPSKVGRILEVLDATTSSSSCT